MEDKWPILLGVVLALAVVGLLAWQAWDSVLPWQYL